MWSAELRDRNVLRKVAGVHVSRRIAAGQQHSEPLVEPGGPLVELVVESVDRFLTADSGRHVRVDEGRI